MMTAKTIPETCSNCGKEKPTMRWNYVDLCGDCAMREIERALERRVK